MLGMNQSQLELIFEYIELQKLTDNTSEKRKKDIKKQLINEARESEGRLQKIRDNLKSLGK